MKEHIINVESGITHAVEVKPDLLKRFRTDSRADLLQEFEGAMPVKVCEARVVIYIVTSFPTLAKPIWVDLQNLSEIHGAPLLVAFPVNIMEENVVCRTPRARRLLVAALD